MIRRPESSYESADGAGFSSRGRHNDIYRSKSRRRNTICIVGVCVLVALAVFVLHKVGVLGLKIQIANVEITQTCRHTIVTFESGEKVGVGSGLLMITGDLQMSNTSLLPRTLDVTWRERHNFIISGNVGGEIGEVIISELDPATREFKPITKCKIPGRTTKTFMFASNIDSPLLNLFLVFSPFFSITSMFSNQQTIIPSGRNLLSVVPLTKPAIMKRGGKIEEGRLCDAVEFRIAVSNPTNTTWKFDLSETIKVVDDNGGLYSYIKPKPGCPELTLKPGEKKELTLQFITLSVGRNPRLEYFSPFSTTPVPSD